MYAGWLLVSYQNIYYMLSIFGITLFVHVSYDNLIYSEVKVNLFKGTQESPGEFMEQFNSTTRAPLDGGAPMPHFSMGNRGSLERASFQNNHMAASLPPVHSQMNNCRFPNLNSMEVRSFVCWIFLFILHYHTMLLTFSFIIFSHTCTMFN